MEDTLREWSVCKVGGYEEKKADGRSEGMAQSNEESQIRKKSLLYSSKLKTRFTLTPLLSLACFKDSCGFCKLI